MPVSTVVFALSFATKRHVDALGNVEDPERVTTMESVPVTLAFVGDTSVSDALSGFGVCDGVGVGVIACLLLDPV